MLEVGVPEHGASKIRVREPGMLQIGTGKAGALEIDGTQPGTRELRELQVGALEERVPPRSGCEALPH